MKRVLCFSLLLATLAACDNAGSNSKDPADSIESRKDTLMENVDSTAQAKRDSIARWEEEQKKKIDSTADKRIDSAKKTQ
jgi:hypothetical protein